MTDGNKTDFVFVFVCILMYGDFISTYGFNEATLSLSQLSLPLPLPLPLHDSNVCTNTFISIICNWKTESYMQYTSN